MLVLGGAGLLLTAQRDELLLSLQKERRLLENRRLDLDICKARVKKAKQAEAKAAVSVCVCV